MCFSFTMLAPCFLLGLLLLCLVLQLVCRWSLQQCSLSVFSQFSMSSFLIFWILFCFVLLLLLHCDVGFYFSLLGALSLHLVLQLVHQWSFLTMLIVYFLTIFGESFFIFWIMFCFTSFFVSWLRLLIFSLIGTLFLHWCCDFYIGEHHQ